VRKSILKQLQIACDITYSIPGLKQHLAPYRKNVPTDSLNFKDEFIVIKGGHKDRDVGIIGLVDFNNYIRKRYDILIAFKGTVGLLDWLNDCKGVLVNSPYSKGKVHKGFLDSIRNLEEEMYEKVVELLKESSNAKIYITGHSKGGALATLMAKFLINKNKKFKRKIKVVTFGSPRVGDKDFRSDYDVEHYRYESFWDLVPHLPFSEQECSLCEKVSDFFEKNPMLSDFMKLTPYTHVGEARVFKKNKKRKLDKIDIKIDFADCPLTDVVSEEELKSFVSLISGIKLGTLPEIIDAHVFDYDDIDSM